MKKILILLLLVCSTAYARLTGEGLTVAIIDTGIRTTHIDFASRILATVNLSDDDEGLEYDVNDYWGHGTLIAGIIGANGVNKGTAPNCNFVIIKIVNKNTIGGLTWERINKALTWVLDHHGEYNITVVNMSITTGGNFLEPTYTNDVTTSIKELRNLNIPVVCPAGNSYKQFQTEGMCTPAAWKETISVGAIDDGKYITAFSQRITDVANPYRTDAFAPGINITSSGIGDDEDTATSSGTSFSCGFVSGTILLMQEKWQRRHKGSLPSVDILEEAFSFKTVDKYGYPVLVQKKALRYIRRISKYGY